MGTMVETDIDRFIRNHKEKLQAEREQLTDRTRVPQQQGLASPSGRRQWDREGGRNARPAEQKQSSIRQNESNLAINSDSQEEKQKQLKQERQREYNDLLAKTGPSQKRKPPTPRHEGLPLGTYADRKKELEKERNQEMKQALAQQRAADTERPGHQGQIFDYEQVLKQHMAEKSLEYKDFVLQQDKKKGVRKIITPEQGFFVGPDQTERNKLERQKNVQNRKELEKQRDAQLLARARQMGIVIDGGSKSKPSQPPENQPADRSPRDHYVERIMDMPKVSFEDSSPREEKRTELNRGDELRLDLQNDAGRYGARGRERQKDNLFPRRPRHRSPSPPLKRRSHSPRDKSGSPKYKDHSPRHRSYSPRDRSHFPPDRPKVPVARSRSPILVEELLRPLSPTEQDHALFRNRELSSADKKAWVANLEKKQQVLQEEYKREVAEQQRLATEQPPQGDPDFDRRQILEKERRQELQEYLATHPPITTLRRKEVTPEDLRRGLPLDQSKHDEERKVLLSERREEYKQHIQQKEQQSRPRREYPEGTAATLPVGDYDDRRKQQLYDERHSEYLQLQQEKQAKEKHRGLPPRPQTPNAFFKKMGQHDQQKQKLNQERKKEYNQRLAERGEQELSRPTTQYTQNPASRGRAPAPVLQETGEYQASVPIRSSDSAEVRKIKQRNAEYNEFLKVKKEKDAHRLDHKKPPTARHGRPPSPKARRADKNKDTYATLPGLHYSDSAEKLKVKERNKEYNEFLKEKGGPPVARTGWQTPTYEEILDQKRKEENARRQVEDADYEGPRLRAYASDGAINRLDNDYRQNSLDKEYEARGIRVKNKLEASQRPLSDYQVRRQRLLDLGRDLESLTMNVKDDVGNKPVEEQQPEMAARVERQNYLATLPVGHDETGSAKRRKQDEYRKELQLQMEETLAAKKREKINELRVSATGLLDPEKNSKRMRGLGGEPSRSPRREYKAKQVEPYHTKFLQDDSGNYNALGKSGDGGREFGRGPGVTDYGGFGTSLETEAQLRPRATPPLALGTRATPPLALGQGTDLGNFDYSGDNLQLDLSGLGPGGRRSRRDGGLRSRRDHDTGILETGFQGLLESRRNTGITNPPPGLMYQAATYVTGGGNIGIPYSSIDEAYHRSGMTNPLDPGESSGSIGLPLGREDFSAPLPRGSPIQRVTFADEQPPISHRKRDRSRERISPYQFPSDDDGRSISRSEKANYQAELERQIAERRQKKQREKEEQDRYDRKLEEEIRNYNPFGRGGGGAPVKDAAGNPVADLRSLRRNEDDYQSARRSPYHSPRGSPSYSPRPPSPRDDKIKPPPQQLNVLGETTHARGGHGIFGQPLTEAEKGATDKYKDELRLQIEDKRRREQMLKEQERMEEEKENRRLEEQRRRMQEDYEEEQKKIRAREEETRRKNEELKKQAEDRKREQERQRREADDARMREKQQQLEREREERQRQEQQRNSPPVPSLRTKGWSPSHDHYQYNYYLQKEEEEAPAPKSPPLPAQRAGKETPDQRKPSPVAQRVEPVQRSNSSDVLNQLASMRKQLQSERQRVENALANSKNEPDVFDARVIQKPPAVGAFDKALNKNASLPPPRATSSDLANARNVQNFNEIKFGSDSKSRREFRSMFPEAPMTNVTLEAQQDAMLRQQENQLKHLKERNPFDQAGPSNVGYGRHGTNSARSQLQSNSAFIDVDGVNGFPDDFDDLPARNDSARARRRDRYTDASPRPVSIINGMGSQASLDVERIQRKNDDRLRRLQQMTGDDVSTGDPDDILDRFIAKQRYNRPPSGQTLQDDSWLRPGSKP